MIHRDPYIISLPHPFVDKQVEFGTLAYVLFSIVFVKCRIGNPCLPMVRMIRGNGMQKTKKGTLPEQVPFLVRVERKGIEPLTFRLPV